MKIRVLRMVRIDGVEYARGVVDVKQGDGQRLLLEHAGVFEAVVEATPVAPSKAAKPAEDKAITPEENK
jgi:hypothetical protein